MKTQSEFERYLGVDIPKYLNGMTRYQLEALEDAIHVCKLRLMQTQVEAAGFRTSLQGPGGEWFGYLCVYDPTKANPGEWASLAEAQILLDTVANLPPAEAFSRWRLKVAPFEKEEYTLADARQDAAEEVRAAQERYHLGEDEAEDLQRSTLFARQLVDEAKAAAVTLGRKGGSQTSDRKSNSSRENGKRGGRPRKQKDNS